MKVAVLDDYQRVAEQLGAWHRLFGCEITFFHERLVDDAEVADRLKDFEVIVAMRERTELSREIIEKLPRLRLIVTSGEINRAIDLDAAKEHGVTVCGTGWAPDATVETAWALLLGLAQRVKQHDLALRAGEWQRCIGVSLKGNTLGVLGLGSVGSKVAMIGRAFGMRVLAYSHNLTRETAERFGAEYVDKKTLLQSSDFVTVHLRLSDRTRNLIAAPELALMKPSALLVNTSRAPLVNERDLAEALRSGQIAGAGVDVFDVEPIAPDNPLLTAPNTLLTPHVGYVTREVYATWYEAMIEDIEAFMRGQPIRIIASPAGHCGTI